MIVYAGGAVRTLRIELQTVQMQLRDSRASLREARASVEGAHTSGGLEHLKQIFRKFIEMDEADNAALFKVLVTMLDYPPAERRRMEGARERRVANRSSIWGRIGLGGGGALAGGALPEEGATST